MRFSARSRKKHNISYLDGNGAYCMITRGESSYSPARLVHLGPERHTAISRLGPAPALGGLYYSELKVHPCTVWKSCKGRLSNSMNRCRDHCYIFGYIGPYDVKIRIWPESAQEFDRLLTSMRQSEIEDSRKNTGRFDLRPYIARLSASLERIRLTYSIIIGDHWKSR